MGFRISWLAVEGLEKPEMLDQLGLCDTGKPDPHNEAPFSAAALPTGWSVLWANDEGYVTAERAARLSARAQVLAVTVDETCMHCHVRSFENGSERWRLWHEGDEVIDHLGRIGEPPPDAAIIEAEQRVLQEAEGPGAEVDFLFDIPTRLAERLCGFKHDAMVEGWQDRFTAAEPLGTARVGLLGRLFGR